MLKGKTILLGVTGGIAAYKSVEIVSRLRKEGAQVDVVMTKAATEFVSPLTFRSLSLRPVYTDMFAEPKSWNVEHIALAERADYVLVAPATANIIAKMALGLADDFLSTVLLAVRKPILVAPAMNQAMYHHPATQQNLKTLRERGVHIIGPARGFQACGSEGEGRMSEPAEILAKLMALISAKQVLQGQKVLVTAGGTREPIDPVRYIGNFSSGKMGYAIASAFAEAGADVTLVSAPTALQPPVGVKVINVLTAEDMYREVLKLYKDQDIVIKAAAVADYRPQICKEQKIKKSGENLVLELVPNPDILAALGEQKEHQFLVGFAAETENILHNGLEKMRKKKANMLVVNDVTKPGAGFGTDTNIVSFLFEDGTRKDLPRMSKLEIARELVKEIAALKKEKDTKKKE
ncbi:MAG TPA: bifunctional phosphopantothenoylcysteine decarboxylase/phosphopantothenate--cysteine ligase CoaBC [Peptococcaceae bacterium]|nr:bifunctional phosphopantothenoylcysteine decarboxylase/phosphopantothenate--cysteine ligase CoaBC [Peptococcaceae bacterium]